MILCPALVKAHHGVDEAQPRISLVHLGATKVQPRAKEPHLEALKLTLEPCKLTLEPGRFPMQLFRPTLKPRRLTQEPRGPAHPGVVQAHVLHEVALPGVDGTHSVTMKTHHVAVLAHPNSIEAHSGTLYVLWNSWDNPKVHPGTAEVHSGVVKMPHNLTLEQLCGRDRFSSSGGSSCSVEDHLRAVEAPPWVAGDHLGVMGSPPPGAVEDHLGDVEAHFAASQLHPGALELSCLHPLSFHLLYVSVFFFYFPVFVYRVCCCAPWRAATVRPRSLSVGGRACPLAWLVPSLLTPTTQPYPISLVCLSLALASPCLPSFCVSLHSLLWRAPLKTAMYLWAPAGANNFFTALLICVFPGI
jgi:hypothetical protein